MNAPSPMITKAIGGVPECVAAGFVDLRSGMLLDIKTAEQHPAGAVDLAAAAIADLFQGPNVVALEAMFKETREDLAEQPYFQEIMMTGENLRYVFLRSKKNPDYVAVFVCRNSTSLGMVLARARLALPVFEASI